MLLPHTGASRADRGPLPRDEGHHVGPDDSRDQSNVCSAVDAQPVGGMDVAGGEAAPLLEVGEAALSPRSASWRVLGLPGSAGLFERSTVRSRRGRIAGMGGCMVIAVRGLTKRYRDVVAVDDIFFDVEAGSASPSSRSSSTSVSSSIAPTASSPAAAPARRHRTGAPSLAVDLDRSGVPAGARGGFARLRRQLDVRRHRRDDGHDDIARCARRLRRNVPVVGDSGTSSSLPSAAGSSCSATCSRPS